MGKIIHRIDQPPVSRVVVGHPGHTIDDRVTHVDVGTCHIDLGAQYFLAVCIASVFHVLEQFQVLLNGAVSVRTLLTRLGKSPSVFTNLVGCQVAHISLPFFDQLHRALVHLLEIIRSKVEPVFPVGTQPGDIFLDGFDEFCLFLRGVGIVKAQVEFPAVFLGQSVI